MDAVLVTKSPAIVYKEQLQEKDWKPTLKGGKVVVYMRIYYM